MKRANASRDAVWSLARSASLVLVLAGVAVTAACVVHTDGALSTAASDGMEYDVDRPGSDFNNFDLQSASPALCRDACLADGRCVAYTYVRPGIQGPMARCWLKNTVPTAVSNTCCVSGVRGYASAPPPQPVAPPPAPVAVAQPAPAPAPPPPPATAAPVMRGAPPVQAPIAYTPVPGGGPFEYGIDRPGYDFQNFDLPRVDPALCQRACMDHPTCQSFTFVQPGVQGPNARCWLKNTVAPSVPNTCCISGVKAPAPPPAGPPHPMHPRWGRVDRDDDRHDGRHDRGRHGGRRIEPGVDRPGSDFQNFDLPRPEPELCARSCWDNQSCVAFTYVRPGVQGPNARCWLKNAVPQAVPNNCCISGVR